METKFTPGPWRVWGSDILADDLNGDDICIGVAGKQSGLITLLSVPGRDKIKANARLMAAAPELFEALIEVKKYMKRAPFSVFQKINAALAKVQS